MKKQLAAGFLTLFTASACQDDTEDKKTPAENTPQQKVDKTDSNQGDHKEAEEPKVTDEAMMQAFNASCVGCHQSSFPKKLNSIDLIKDHCETAEEGNKLSKRFDVRMNNRRMPQGLSTEAYEEWLTSEEGLALTTWATENGC